ncbi:MAG TPA: carbohydrate porin [Gammaproteobacteria bacterium]|jgi:hypothetical protein
MRKNILISLAVAAALAAPLAHADAGDTTVGGVVFADFTSISTTQDAPVIPLGATAPSKVGDIDPNGFGIDVKRAYFIVNHQIDDIWSANLTTDFNFASYKDACSISGGAVGETCTVTTTTPETQLFVKKVYLQGKFDDLAVLRIGSADMPWIPYAESVYGYRFVENTLIDRSYGGFGPFGNSADWGVNMNGGNSIVNYSVSAVNGGGYKNMTRSKSMDFEGRVAVTPIDGLILAGGFYTGKRDLDTEKTPAVNTASRLDALVAWKASGLTVGLEWFSADKWNDVLNPGTTTKSDGTSIFASYDIPNTDFSVFGRSDTIKPTKDTDANVKDQYYNLGFAWKENKSLTWAVAYKSDKVTDNLKYKLDSDQLKTEELGVWIQVKY